MLARPLTSRPRAMRLWLTRRPNGTYMLTKLRPLIRKRLGSDEFDAYERTEPGEPIGVRHLCEEGVRAVLGTILPTLTPRRVLFMLTLQPAMDESADEPRARRRGVAPHRS